MSYDLDDVKARADLSREVADRVGSGKLANGRELFTCPHPNHNDSTPSFTVYLASSSWYCYGCGRGGDVIDLVTWLDGLSVFDAITYLGDKYGGDGKAPRNNAKKTPTRKARNLVTAVADTARPLDDETAAAILSRFVEGRGWSPTVTELVSLSVVLDAFGRPRVRFPFLKDGRALLWQDRAVGATVEPKWLTPRGATLYPFGVDCLDRYDSPDLNDWPDCPIVGAPAVWIVEGPADAVTLLDLWPSMSVLGLAGVSSWSVNYAENLSGLTVVVITDNDTPGRDLRETLSRDLDDWAAVLHVHVPEELNDLGDWATSTDWETFADDLIATTVEARASYLSATGVTA